jgi:hypothetical protein
LPQSVQSDLGGEGRQKHTENAADYMCAGLPQQPGDPASCNQRDFGSKRSSNGGPKVVRVRQILGGVSQFEKANLVAKLKHARA